MADTEIRVERWENGILVGTQVFQRPAEDVNRDTITERALAALDTNAAIVAGADAYLAIASPTNAQVAAQVRDLTTAARLAAQQRNGLIRLLLQRFDSTD